MRFFSRYYRVITYSARGFKPSAIPADPALYSQAHARDDIIAVLDHLKIERAHIAGLSMGGFATLHAGITYPDRARSLVIAGCGYGAAPAEKEKFQKECEAAARLFETNGAETSKQYAIGPTRVQYQNKDPRGWTEFAQQLGRARLAGPGQYHARGADEAAFAVGAGRRDEEDHGADPDCYR